MRRTADTAAPTTDFLRVRGPTSAMPPAAPAVGASGGEGGGVGTSWGAASLDSGGKGASARSDTESCMEPAEQSELMEATEACLSSCLSASLSGGSRVGGGIGVFVEWSSDD